MTKPTIEINVSFYESQKENESENNAFIVREVIETTLKPGENFIAVYPRVFTQHNNVDKLTGEIDRIENLYTFQDLGEITTIPWLEPIYLQKEIERDEADYYKFELTDESVCSLTLEELTNNANLEIFDNDGQTILFSQKYTPKVDKLLEAGDYYVRVYPEGKVKTNYNLILKEESDFSFTLDELGDDANLEILDNDGKAILFSQEPATTEAELEDLDLEIEKLLIKNYAIQIYYPEKISTKYLLTAKKFNGFEEMVYR